MAATGHEQRGAGALTFTGTKTISSTGHMQFGSGAMTKRPPQLSGGITITGIFSGAIELPNIAVAAHGSPGVRGSAAVSVPTILAEALGGQRGAGVTFPKVSMTATAIVGKLIQGALTVRMDVSATAKITTKAVGAVTFNAPNVSSRAVVGRKAQGALVLALQLTSTARLARSSSATMSLSAPLLSARTHTTAHGTGRLSLPRSLVEGRKAA